jgi:hypothetical protein
MSLMVPSADEMQNTNDFGVLEADDYRCRIESYKEVNRGGMYAKRDEDGNPLPTIDFYLKPLAFASDEDAELVDAEGEPISPEKHLVFFYDPHRLGARPMISRSRKFLASALGVPPEGRINLPGGLDDLIGRELIASVSDANGLNKITDTRPVSRRRQRVRVEEPKEDVTEKKETDEPEW